MKAPFLLFCLLILMTLLQGLKPFIDDQSRMHERAGELWESASADTKLRLEYAVEGLLLDQALPLLLSGKSYSLSQLLKNHESEGRISALGIYKANCVKVSVSKLSGHPLHPCPRSANSGSVTKLKFQESLGAPVITHWKRIAIDRKALWVFAETILDDNWQAKYPDLAQLGSDNGLRMTTQPEASEIVIKAWTSSVDFYLVMTPSALWSYVAALMPPEYLGIIQLALSLIAIIVLLSFWRGTHSFRSNYKRLIGDLRSWLADLHSNDPSKVKLPKVMESTREQDQSLAVLKGDFLKILVSYSKAFKQTEAKLERCQYKRMALKQELNEANLEIAGLPFYLSLANQIANQVPKIQSELKSSWSLLEDVSDVLHLSLVPQLQKLHEISSYWQQGCRQMSPRKFFRSLSERQLLDGSNELYRSLEAVTAASHKAINISINIAIQTRKASAKNKNLTKYMSHWDGLGKFQPNAEVGVDLPAILTSALALDGDEKKWALDIEGIKKLDAGIESLNIPVYVWQSVFYHIYMFFTEKLGQNYGQESSLAITMHEKAGKHHLIFRVQVENLECFKGSSHGAAHHLDLAGRLCKHLPINLDILPSLSRDIGLRLSWHSEVAGDLGSDVSQKKDSMNHT